MNPLFEQFQQNVNNMIAQSPAADIEKNVRAMMASAFSKMDLVTREAFDEQVDLVRQTIERLTALEAQIQTLESRIAQLEPRAE